MGYLIFQILFFLLIAALLGFVIGWLLRNSRLQSELKDLDARWRAKLSEVEGERDQFAGEVNQANEARARFEASAADARRLAEQHEASLQQLQREHQSKLDAFAEAEKRVSGLEGDLAARDKELTEAKASLARQESAGGDAERAGRDLAAATSRAETLERELRQAKEANGACRREVERLEARIAELEHAGTGGTAGGALGLVGGTDTVRGDDREAAGSGGGSAGFGATATSDAPSDTGSRPGTTSPSHLAEAGGPSFTDPSTGAPDSGDRDDEGVRPEALTEARGGVADDLKKISGVGPKLEKTLNGLGIYHFSQIAAFTPGNVTWVDRHLRFKGRIDREKWIEQAQVLAAGGETEFSRRG